MILYVGTYSVRGSEGIYLLDFNRDTGKLTMIGTLANPRNPSFLALSPRGPWLYSVCEEQKAGAVTALALRPGPGEERTLGHQSTLGVGPCHLAVDPTGQWLVSANYGSGDVALHPIRADGGLEPATDLARHTGSGPDVERQSQPHAHSANFDPSGRFIVAPDLGSDRLMVYELDREQGKLKEHLPGGVVVQPGAGPRHFTFHANRQWAYLINELDNTIVAYRWDEAGGTLTPVQTLSTLPADFVGTSYCADIHIHPSGRFLYGSNRGHDSLAIFALDPATGLLEARGYVPTGGEHPRNFAISADGEWLLVGNMNSDNIVVFRIGEDGGLEQVGEPFGLPAPVCLLFAAAE